MVPRWRGKKKRRKKNKRQDENIMVCPIHRATITSVFASIHNLYMLNCYSYIRVSQILPTIVFSSLRTDSTDSWPAVSAEHICFLFQFLFLIASAKEDVIGVVCLSVCLSVCQQLCAKTSKRICVKFSGKVGNGPMNE